jgi:hypothetical protein
MKRKEKIMTKQHDVRKSHHISAYGVVNIIRVHNTGNFSRRSQFVLYNFTRKRKSFFFDVLFLVLYRYNVYVLLSMYCEQPLRAIVSICYYEKEREKDAKKNSYAEILVVILLSIRLSIHFHTVFYRRRKNKIIDIYLYLYLSIYIYIWITGIIYSIHIIWTS